MSETLKPLHDWRHLVASEHGPPSPTTRHVLLTLSLYMSVKGDSCFPSIETLEIDTGLSKPAVIKHLKIARETGWLAVTRHGFDGQRWARHEYRATIPDGLPQEPKAVNEDYHLGDEKAVNEVNHVGNEGGKPGDERRLTSVEKVVNEVNPNYPYNNPIKSSVSARAREAPESDLTPLDLYKNFFPHVRLNWYQTDLISGIDDMSRWRKALEFWAGNDHISKNVQNIVDYYHELAHKQPKAEPILSLDNFK